MKPLRTVAYAYGQRNRRRKLDFLLEFINHHRLRRVLLVGVSRRSGPIVNLIERELMSRQQELTIVASGVDDASGGTDWPDYHHADARDLPFADQSFDLVYANAVIEHVGGEQDQQRMVDEMNRVGRSWIATTPNRLFPVEAHYHTVFSHMRPGWSKGYVTRLLSPADLRHLAGPHATIVGSIWSPTLTAVKAPARPGCSEPLR